MGLFFDALEGEISEMSFETCGDEFAAVFFDGPVHDEAWFWMTDFEKVSKQIGQSE